MAAETKTRNALLKKGASFEFTAEHTQIVQTLLEQLLISSRRVLALQDSPAAISVDRPFQLFTDASVDGLGAVVEREQHDGTTCLTCILGRATLPNENKRSATELEGAAIVWTAKKNRQPFYTVYHSS